MKIQATPDGGESIEQACAEAVALANQLHVGVQFEFNGRPLCAAPGNAPMDLVAQYRAGP